jgi:hypothetical protein
MYVLVDYDNVERGDRVRGLAYLALKILDSVGANRFAPNDRAEFRLYGGWYESAALSSRAQALVADAQAQFPTAFSLGVAGTLARVRVTVDLARSMIIDPQIPLLNTYRRRTGVSNVESRPLPWAGCVNPNGCSVLPLQHFLANSECPAATCPVRPEEILQRAEQKLVDTMLTADLIKLSTPGVSIAVVSSDDDMWPGIKTALLHGARIIHVHTHAARRTPIIYSRAAGQFYHESTL